MSISLKLTIVNGNPLIYYNGIISEEEKYDEDGFQEEITILKEER